MRVLKVLGVGGKGGRVERTAVEKLATVFAELCNVTTTTGVVRGAKRRRKLPKYVLSPNNAQLIKPVLFSTSQPDE